MKLPQESSIGIEETKIEMEWHKLDKMMTKVDVSNPKSGCQNIIVTVEKKDEKQAASYATCKSFLLKYLIWYST